MPTPVPSGEVAAHLCPSSAKSRASTACVDLDAFSTENSRSSDDFGLISPFGVDHMSISSEELWSADDILAGNNKPAGGTRHKPADCVLSTGNLAPLGAAQDIVNTRAREIWITNDL